MSSRSVLFDLRILVESLTDSAELDLEATWSRRDFECKVELSWTEWFSYKLSTTNLSEFDMQNMLHQAGKSTFGCGHLTGHHVMIHLHQSLSQFFRIRKCHHS